MANQKRLHSLIFLLFIASVNSCTHSYYVPNDNIMVQLKNKNEIKVSGSFSPANTGIPDRYSISVNTIQAGYSPIKNVAIAGSYFGVKDFSEYSDYSNGKGHLWNAALGTYYFINFGDRINKNVAIQDRVFSPMDPCGLLIDIYAGYGQGKLEHTYYTNGQSFFDFQNYFIQGGFHFTSPFFDAGFSLKKSLLNYHNASTNYEISEYDLENIENLLQNNPYQPVQLSIKLAGGIKYGKAYVNFNANLSPNYALQSDDPHCTLGLQLDVNEIVKGFKKK